MGPSLQIMAGTTPLRSVTAIHRTTDEPSDGEHRQEAARVQGSVVLEVPRPPVDNFWPRGQNFTGTNPPPWKATAGAQVRHTPTWVGVGVTSGEHRRMVGKGQLGIEHQFCTGSWGVECGVVAWPPMSSYPHNRSLRTQATNKRRLAWARGGCGVCGVGWVGPLG